VKRLAGAALALGLLASLFGCAKRVAVPVPEGEEYVFPAGGPGEVSADDMKTLRAAWSDVLTGNTQSAAARYEKLLKRRTGLVPARTGLAYARLRAGRVEEAASLFTAVLAERPDDVAALVGAGSAAFRRGDLDAALGFLRRAQAVAPSDGVVRRRLTALKLQATERRMSLAQAAIERGDAETAVREYQGALEAAPEVADVRLALADLLASRGDVPGAIAVLAADPSGDRQVALRRAGLLMSQKEFEEAEGVYRELLARDPADETARAGAKAASEGLELLAMPEEYRRIAEAPRVTRADLAALVAVRVRALQRLSAGQPQVAVDISLSWARDYVARVLALGIMEVYPNHTFQPGAVVRRADLARAVGRTLDSLGFSRSPSPAPTDMSPSHLDYEAVQRVLGAGLMGLTATGAFEPWRPVSGAEAIEVVDGVARLAGP
jgi:tetratricopeptide (TPR) repeat protein